MEFLNCSQSTQRHVSDDDPCLQITCLLVPLNKEMNLFIGSSPSKHVSIFCVCVSSCLPSKAPESSSQHGRRALCLLPTHWLTDVCFFWCVFLGGVGGGFRATGERTRTLCFTTANIPDNNSGDILPWAWHFERNWLEHSDNESEWEGRRDSENCF